MFYDEFFDINGDGKMDGFEEFMEYKAFRGFSGDEYLDLFDPDFDDELGFLDDEEEDEEFY